MVFHCFPMVFAWFSHGFPPYASELAWINYYFCSYSDPPLGHSLRYEGCRLVKDPCICTLWVPKQGSRMPYQLGLAQIGMV